MITVANEENKEVAMAIDESLLSRLQREAIAETVAAGSNPDSDKMGATFFLVMSLIKENQLQSAEIKALRKAHEFLMENAFPGT